MKYIVDIANIPDRIEAEVQTDAAGMFAVSPSVEGRVELFPSNGTPVRMVRIGDQMVRAVVARGERRGEYTLQVNGYTYSLEAADERTRAIRDLTAKSAAASGPAPLKAPMPGLIVRVNVNVGDSVDPGQGLVVMEAMKMENELKSSSSGTVKAILVEAGKAVDKGAILVELE